MSPGPAPPPKGTSIWSLLLFSVLESLNELLSLDRTECPTQPPFPRRTSVSTSKTTTRDTQSGNDSKCCILTKNEQVGTGDAHRIRHGFEKKQLRKKKSRLVGHKGFEAVQTCRNWKQWCETTRLQENPVKLQLVERTEAQQDEIRNACVEQGVEEWQQKACDEAEVLGGSITRSGLPGKKQIQRQRVENINNDYPAGHDPHGATDRTRSEFCATQRLHVGGWTPWLRKVWADKRIGLRGAAQYLKWLVERIEYTPWCGAAVQVVGHRGETGPTRKGHVESPATHSGPDSALDAETLEMGCTTQMRGSTLEL